MNLIYKVEDADIGEEKMKMDNPKVRYASRGIVLNAKNEIALFYKEKMNEYKLPGGGIEENEKAIDAFKREVLEETGCIIDNINELGIIEEYKSHANFKQRSYVFVGNVKEDTNKLYITDKEKAEGAKLMWKSPENALKLIKECYDNLLDSPYDKDENVYSTKFIAIRDQKILEYFMKEWYQK